MESTKLNTKKTFECSICKKTYQRYLFYLKHSETVHNNNDNIEPKSNLPKEKAKRGRPSKQKEKSISNNTLLYKFIESLDFKRQSEAENDLIASCGELGFILHNYLGETKKTHNGILMGPYEKPCQVQTLYGKVSKDPIFIKKLLDIHLKDQFIDLEVKCIDTSFLENQNLNTYEVIIAILIYLSKLFKEKHLKEIIAIFIGFMHYMDEKGIDARQRTCWTYLKDYGDNHWETYISKKYIKDTALKGFKLLDKSLHYSSEVGANITKECKDYEGNYEYWDNASFIIRFLEKIYGLLHAYNICYPRWNSL